MLSLASFQLLAPGDVQIWSAVSENETKNIMLIIIMWINITEKYSGLHDGLFPITRVKPLHYIVWNSWTSKNYKCKRLTVLFNFIMFFTKVCVKLKISTAHYSQVRPQNEARLTLLLTTNGCFVCCNASYIYFLSPRRGKILKEHFKYF